MHNSAIKTSYFCFFLASISGIYIPGIEHKRFNPKITRFASTALILSTLFLAVDQIVFILNGNTIGERLIAIFYSTYYTWNFLRAITWFFKKSKMEKVLELWSNFNVKQEHLKEYKLKTIKYLTIPIFCGVFFGLIAGVQIFTLTLCFPSNANSDNQSLNAPLWLCLIHNMGNIVTPLSLLSLEWILALALNHIIIELKCLEKELKHIVWGLYVQENGQIMRSSFKEDYLDALRDNLKTWSIRHRLLIKWMKTLGELYTIPIVLNYIFMVLGTCGLCFLALKGYIPFANMCYAAMTSSTVISAYFFATKMCDEIENIEKRLYKSAMEQDWYIYPKDIQQNFKIIQMSCEIPINISLKGYLPLNWVTFNKMFLLQYRFMTFLNETISK